MNFKPMKKILHKQFNYFGFYWAPTLCWKSKPNGTPCNRSEVWWEHPRSLSWVQWLCRQHPRAAPTGHSFWGSQARCVPAPRRTQAAVLSPVQKDLVPRREDRGAGFWCACSILCLSSSF